tara:strand:+ start:35869 stop:36672 length:804 start_codon:yes stop_codon:yes gene_type:complete
MPLSATSYFLPASSNVPFIIEDTYLKGGYRVFKTISDRDQWVQDAIGKSFNGLIEQFDARKEGQLAYVVEDAVIYKLTADKETWEELKFGTDYQVEAPIQVIGESTISIDPDRVVPVPGTPGQILGLDANKKPVWIDYVSNSGTRGIVEYEMEESLESGDLHDFDLPDVGKVVMLLKLEVNALDLKVEGFTTAARDDKNPYTYISDVNLLVDEGIQVQDDGSYKRFRRYSFLANLDDPVERTLHFRFTNVGDAPIRPKMTLTYLVQE